MRRLRQPPAKYQFPVEVAMFMIEELRDHLIHRLRLIETHKTHETANGQVAATLEIINAIMTSQECLYETAKALRSRGHRVAPVLSREELMARFMNEN
jgi:hypothetical protein